VQLGTGWAIVDDTTTPISMFGVHDHGYSAPATM
jgi:hypothetical protein